MSHETTTTAEAQPPVADLVDHLMQFEGPPDQFLLHLLAVQCRVGSAEGGAILRAGPKQDPEVLALFPPADDKAQAPAWLTQAMQVVHQAISSTESITAPIHMPDQLYGQEPQAYLVLIPLRGNTGVRGAAAFFLATSDTGFIGQCAQRLELTVSLLSLYEMRLTLQARHADLQRLRRAMEVLAAINEMSRYKATTMAFCNELASAFGAERVSVGFLKGRYVRTEGTSHTEKIVRKMELVQAIESAMEESLDQDVEVLHPAPAEATFVSRAAKDLATRHGPTTVCSLPLRRAGKAEGVLTIERAQDQLFTLDEVETARLAGDLCTARLLELREHDKWVGAKAADAARKGFASLVGPRHTWVKIIVVGVVLAVLFLTFYRADWRVEAPFEIQTIQRHIISAPFAGRIEQVHLERGDPVVAGQTILVTMETADLKAAWAKANAQRLESRKAAALAYSQGNKAESQIHQHRAEQAQADMTLLEHNIERAQIRCQIDGRVVRGDLKGSEGASFDQGAELFRVAPVDRLRAELLVPEKRIADVTTAMAERRQKREEQGMSEDHPQRRDGDLAAVAFPGYYLPFVIDRISPAAEVIDQRNVFRVRVGLQLHLLEETPHWLEPGLEGVAKVHIGKASYAWLWTRDLVAWVRMKLWW